MWLRSGFTWRGGTTPRVVQTHVAGVPPCPRMAGTDMTLSLRHLEANVAPPGIEIPGSTPDVG